jgi:cytidyltransferase-like protein
MKIVIVTGGFDPIHSGHISYLNAARELGDWLLVGVNSDAWLERKKGRAFMPVEERLAIVYNLKSVDAVKEFDDSDGSACTLIEWVKSQFPYATEIIFANGGDRTRENIPEMRVDGVTFAFGVGGEDKANSSSWILEEWKAPKTQRPWGYYRVLHEVTGTKVKELTVEPGQTLSMQRHRDRAEYWLVTSGECKVEKEFGAMFVRKHETVHIPVGKWHQLSNPFKDPCKLVEIQYGARCVEEDIERR